jgi:very-short-patch-repair endonuclease
MHKLSFAMEPTSKPRRRTRVEPFLGTEALAAGVVTRHELATHYEAIYRNVYIRRGQQVTPAQRAHAAWLWAQRRATVVGVSAAAIHGSKWIDPRLPAELNQASQHKTRGIELHNDTLTPNEITIIRGMPVTTAARTAFDLGRRHGRTLAVIRVDALLQATALKLSAVDALIDRHRGARGIVQLRQVVRLADAGAESPQETRTRLVLTDAGLRPRRTQIDVFNRFGDHIHRIDMGWPEWKVGVEYDGEQHWTNPAIRAKDIDQQAEVEALGWRLIRVSAEMLRYRPHTIVQRTRVALNTAGRI